jgi:hypothetical protein
LIDEDDAPRHRKRACKPRHKKFGIEQWSKWFKTWGNRTWYATKKSRDQALVDLKRHTCNLYKLAGEETKVRKIDR